MKANKLMAVLLISTLGLSVCACTQTTGTASETPADSGIVTSDVTAPSDSEGVILVGTEGGKDYSITVFNVDGSTVKYVGKTDEYQWPEVFKEVADHTDFTYTVMSEGENRELRAYTQTLESVNGQTPTEGYYACYVNGAYYDELLGGETLYATLAGGQNNDCEIRYTTENYLKSDKCFIPTKGDVIKVVIKCPGEDVMDQIYYRFDLANDTSFIESNPMYAFETAKLGHKTGEVEKGTFTPEYWNNLLDILGEIPDYEVVGLTAAVHPADKYEIVFNTYSCYTSDPTGAIAAFLEECKTMDGMTMN